MESGTIFAKMRGVGMDKTGKMIATARLALPLGGLRSCPLS